jgi:S-adenosylmethionine synthetase
MVAAGLCEEVLVQVAYAIGVAEPVGLYVNTYGTSHVNIDDGKLAKKIGKIFDLRPYAIEKRFNLRSPIYLETASYGHMGRSPRVVTKVFNPGKGNEKKVKVKLFPWEELDYVERLRKEFGLK